MRGLSEASGLPRTTIHHYIREGLLPPAIKSARNAAMYGPQHLERLRLISQLRGGPGGELSIPQIRTALAHSDGLSAEVGSALEAAGLIGRSEADGLSAGDVLVARACAALVEAGVEPADLTPLADLLREVGIYANSLATLYEAETSVRELLDALLWRALET